MTNQEQLCHEPNQPEGGHTRGGGQGRFDTFIFDLDGTLLDTLPDLVEITNAALRAEGFPPRTRDEIKGFVGNGIKALMYQAVPEGSTEDEAERAMARWKEVHPQLDHMLTQPYPGMPETLQALKGRGAHLGVLSNKFDAGVQQVIGIYLPGTFGALHGEGPGFPRKPDPTGLLRTMAELGSAPARTAYVGDSPGDIATARAADTFAIAVAWGYHTAQDLAAANPDALVHSPADLLAFCK